MRLDTRAKEIIARKYARAFINVFLGAISDDDFKKIKSVEQFLRSHQKITFFLEVPSITFDKKKEAVEFIIKKFNLPLPIKKLFLLLLKDDRPTLMEQVLRVIRELYQEQKNVMAFSISTSHNITEKNIHSIVQFLSQKLHCTILYEYTVNPKLIAGMRLQSNTMLWEHSVAKQLRQIRLLV